MDFMIDMLMENIVPITVAFCVGIGFIIKHSLDFIPNKHIPAILGVLGIAMNLWVNDWVVVPQVVVGGLASGLAATGMFELVKNYIE